MYSMCFMTSLFRFQNVLDNISSSKFQLSPPELVTKHSQKKKMQMFTGYSWTVAYTGENMDPFVTRGTSYCDPIKNLLIKKQPTHHLIKIMRGNYWQAVVS